MAEIGVKWTVLVKKSQHLLNSGQNWFITVKNWINLLKLVKDWVNFPSQMVGIGLKWKVLLKKG